MATATDKNEKKDETQKPVSSPKTWSWVTNVTTTKKRRRRKPTPTKTTKKPTTPSKSKEETKEKTLKKETTVKNPNINIKSEEHMLPGIDNLDDYIARKKASAKDHKKESAVSFITPDGTDLLTLPQLYALVPHAKWDHKLVYMKDNIPEWVLDDKRWRTPGNMYVKNGRDIYMVTLMMKEHPTLKNAHGEPYDIWIIENPAQLTEQISAIKQGVWWGENFEEPIVLSTQTETPVWTDASDENVVPEPLQNDELPDVDTVIDQSIWDIDSVDLTLPAEDPEIPEMNVDLLTEEVTTEPTPLATDETSQEATHDEQQPSISLDGLVPEADHDTSSDDSQAESQSQETLSNDSSTETVQPEENTPPVVEEGITLDMPIEEETTSHGLFGAKDEEKNTSVVLPQEDDLPLDTPSAWGLFKKLPDGPVEGATDETPSVWEGTPPTTIDETTSLPQQDSQTNEGGDLPQTEPPAPQEQDTASTSPDIVQAEASPQAVSSFDLDALTIDAGEESVKSNDVSSESIASETIVPKTHSSLFSTLFSQNSTPNDAWKKFPVPISTIVRLVLFVVIVGALILVWKVMFPTIKGTKAPETTPPTAEQWIDGLPLPSDTQLPSDDTSDTPGNLENDTVEPPVDVVEQPGEATPTPTPSQPTGWFTLVELTEKLKLQQIDARKVLNIAKLLENKQAIKFSLAAMLKAGNVLERIDTEPTITAEDVLKESEKIDAYLGEANKLVQ